MVHKVVKALLYVSLGLLLVAERTGRYLFLGGAATFVLGVICLATEEDGKPS